MQINIELDENLLETAMKMSRLQSKKAVIDEALKQFVNRLRRIQMLEFRGQVNWDGDLNQMRSL